MRLLTHNSLRSHAKDVTLGYPLELQIESMEVRETDPDFDFIKHIVPNLSWACVLVCELSCLCFSMLTFFIYTFTYIIVICLIVAEK